MPSATLRLRLVWNHDVLIGRCVCPFLVPLPRLVQRVVGSGQGPTTGSLTTAGPSGTACLLFMTAIHESMIIRYQWSIYLSKIRKTPKNSNGKMNKQEEWTREGETRASNIQIPRALACKTWSQDSRSCMDMQNCARQTDQFHQLPRFLFYFKNHRPLFVHSFFYNVWNDDAVSVFLKLEIIWQLSKLHSTKTWQRFSTRMHSSAAAVTSSIFCCCFVLFLFNNHNNITVVHKASR